ncbi:MAG TPA: AarF/UbiB family protein [Streptosporangiaceae bacterium]|nr:AarF/UbiB family protein [Streptosporangiaceae bacterium]
MPNPRSITASHGQPPDEDRAGMTEGHPQPTRVAAQRERPVLPAGGLRRTSRLAALPLRHAARTAAAATRLSRLAADQVAARTAEQLFGTLGELKGGAAKLGQAMSVFEAAMPEEVAAPYRSALRRLTDAAPPMPAEVAHRVIAADLGAAFGAGWRERLVAFGDTPVAAASIGQVHRGRWRDDRGHIIEVAIKVQYPGVSQALRSDLRQARLLARVMARLTRLNVTGLADELALRIIEELDYVREGRVQGEVAAAFADRVPEVIAQARAAGVREPQGRTRVTVPAVYAATPRVLITRWLDGVSLSALLDGRMDLLPEGWRELGPGDAADLAARLLGHAIYAPAACAGWMHADLHQGNFLLLPGGRLGMLDFGAVAALPGGIPVPFGQLAAAVLAGHGPMAVRLARQVGALGPGRELDERLVVELLHPMVATAAADDFTYSRPWLRGLMGHFTEPRFAPALRSLTPPREYALVWRATLSAAGLFAQLGATVPTRGFHLAYSSGFRDGTLGAQPLFPRADQAGRKTGTDG